MYKVIVSSKAEKDLKHLKKTIIYSKIVAALKFLRNDPFAGDINFCLLRGC